jgi:LacI family transcriptional regulator
LADELKERSRRTTMHDVAELAGVSVMTVSNVVRRQHQFVKLETRRKVEEAIARLNYRPNVSARNLRVAEEYSIGIVIADTNPAFLNDPFISRLVSGLSNYLSNIDYTLDIQGVAPERFESATILRKVGNDALCAILCGPKTLRRQHIDYLEKMGQPVVVFQEVFKSASPNIAFVAQDDFGAGRLVAEHLVKSKPRSAIFVRPMLEWSAIEQREKGVRAVFHASSTETEITTLMVPTETFDDVRAAVLAHLGKRVPDAIIAATDSVGVAVLDACESEGLKVPEDIQVTGFNGFDVWRYTRPALTTVMSPAYEMGRYAGELLVQRLKTGDFQKRSTVFPVALQPGGSS